MIDLTNQNNCDVNQIYINGKILKQPKHEEEETKNFSELFKGIDQKSLRGKTVEITVKSIS